LALVFAAFAVAATAAAGERNLTDLPASAALAEPDLSAPIYAPTSPLASSTLFTDRATFVAAFPALRSQDCDRRLPSDHRLSGPARLDHEQRLLLARRHRHRHRPP